MSNAAAIVEALRARAVAAGYPVILYRMVDPEIDTLPACVVLSHEEGRQADEQAHGLVHRLLDVTIALVARGSDDHIIEALELADDLAGALVQVQIDVPDTLDDAGVNALEVIETRADTRESSTDVYVVELLVRAAYTGVN